ncbi:class I histocompatibility antigen, F10 alpha chain-like isoform 2-T2 [Podargus strigoides]
MGPVLAMGLGLLVWVHVGTACRPHSLRYFSVAVLEPSPGVPEFMEVGYVDGNPFVRYNSKTRKMEPEVGWMAASGHEPYWDTQTQIAKLHQQIYRMNLDTMWRRYNQSRRGRTYQRVYGCDLLEDGSTTGFYKSAYDGKDFINVDLDMMMFDVEEQNKKWEEDRTDAGQCKHYLQNTCIEWLKKHLSSGRAVLERKEPPTARVSGKEAHGILTLYCRAYGFYPRPIIISWLKDGEVRDQETERGSTAPYSDGTYYAWASIEARPEEKDKFWCQVVHASLPEPGLFAWEPEYTLFPIVLGVAVVLQVVAIIGGVIFWKYQWGMHQGSDSSSKGIPA